jgi:hypothetical protein
MHHALHILRYGKTTPADATAAHRLVPALGGPAPGNWQTVGRYPLPQYAAPIRTSNGPAFSIPATGTTKGQFHITYGVGIPCYYGPKKF